MDKKVECLLEKETNSRRTPAAAHGPIPEVGHSLGGSPNVQNKRLPSPNRCTRSVKFGTRSVKIGAGSVKTGTRSTSHYGLIVLSTRYTSPRPETSGRAVPFDFRALLSQAIANKIAGPGDPQGPWTARHSAHPMTPLISPL